jgi:hypothetical protein
MDTHTRDRPTETVRPTWAPPTAHPGPETAGVDRFHWASSGGGMGEVNARSATTDAA